AVAVLAGSVHRVRPARSVCDHGGTLRLRAHGGAAGLRPDGAVLAAAGRSQRRRVHSTGDGGKCVPLQGPGRGGWGRLHAVAGRLAGGGDQRATGRWAVAHRGRGTPRHPAAVDAAGVDRCLGQYGAGDARCIADDRGAAGAPRRQWVAVRLVRYVHGVVGRPTGNVGVTASAATLHRRDRALVDRGNLTTWLSPDAIARWHAKPSRRRGGQTNTRTSWYPETR